MSDIDLRELTKLLRADPEDAFQRGIRETDWFREFVEEYGEEPDLDIKEYDYRKAWASGVRPERDPYDVSKKTGKGRYHWGSSNPATGEMLKSADHPTAWKERFMRSTGQNPDALGLKTQWDGDAWIEGVRRER